MNITSLLPQQAIWKRLKKNRGAVAGLIIIFFALFTAIFSYFIAGFWVHNLWWGFAVMLLLKTFIELIFLYPVARFYNKQNLINWFPLFQPLHIIYTVIAGWLGIFGSFEWKGRRVK